MKMWTSDWPKTEMYRDTETESMMLEPESGFPDSVWYSLTAVWHLYEPSDPSVGEPVPSWLILPKARKHRIEICVFPLTFQIFTVRCLSVGYDGCVSCKRHT